MRQREHLANLGTLSANLAHELNNPAAATVRATAQLRHARRRHAPQARPARLAARIPPEALRGLVELQERAVERAAKADEPLDRRWQQSDLEDAVADRLEELGRRRAPTTSRRSSRRRAGRRLARRRRRPASTHACPAARGGAALARVHPRDRGADGRDRGRLDADLDARRGGQAVLPHGRRHRAGRRRAPRARQHRGHARPQARAASRVVERVRPDAAAGPGAPGRAQPGVDQPHRQRRARDGRARRAHAAHPARRRRRRGRGRRRRPRHPARGAAAHLRGLLHHQAAGTGSGLGLDNARRIVERRHGGTVEVDTGSADGTIFRVRLPFAPLAHGEPSGTGPR